MHSKNRAYYLEVDCMKDYESYIFDLDGTLISSLDDLALSCNYALRSYGMPERSLDEVYDTFRQHYLLHNLDTTAPYPGIPELIQRLTASGKHVAVVSNKFYDATQALVRHFFGDTIPVAIGERENIKKKPAPDTVVEALRQLGMPRETAVYIGDSDVDIETARNCGIPCISVLWGFRSRDFLLEHGATTLASKPEEIFC